MKKFLALFLSLSLLLAAGAALAEDKTFNLDLATGYAAEGPAGVALKQFVEAVKEKSGGTLNITLFTDGTLGTPKENYTSLATGELDLSCTGLEGLDMYAPQFTFLDSPFLMKSFDHLMATLGSGIGDKLVELYQENNIHLLSWHKRDVRNFSSSKPVSKPEDVVGMKLRLPGMTVYVDAWSQLQAIPTTVAMSELYLALQQGTADASEGGYEQFTTLKVYEVQDYTSETQHVYEFVGLFIAQDLFEKLSEAQQQVITECAQEAMAYADQLSEDMRDGYRQQCLDGGMEYVEVDRAAFAAALEEYYRGQFEEGGKWAASGFTWDDVMALAE